MSMKTILYEGQKSVIYTHDGKSKVRSVSFRDLNGDWFVHPRVLTKERPLEFVGRTPSVESPTLTMHQE